MYHCKLMIKLFSADSTLESLLQKTPALEQFEHVFETVDCLSPELLQGADIVILDLAIDIPPAKLRAMCKKSARLILCAEPQHLEESGINLCHGLDDIWLKPLSPALAAFYFQRLLLSVKTEKDLWLTENYLEAMINSIPDLVWFKDIKGAHLKVNDAFCQAVGKSKEDIQGRGHYYIWDLKKEEYEKGEYVCLETEEMVLKEQKTCQFDEKVKSKHGLRQFKTYKSPIFGEDGKPIGTVGIAHDVTDLENIGTEMEIILRSMPFSILVTENDGSIINANERFEKYFHIKCKDIFGYNYSSWKNQTLTNFSGPNEKGFFEATLRNMDNGKRLLEIREEPIYDIFYNLVGHLYIYRDVTAERMMEEQIIHNSNTDFLTGLNNRRYFYEYVSLNRGQQMVSLVYVDLDHFKTLNDTCGHQAGDEALIATADLLRACFPNDFLVRLGGDEFLILILGKCEMELLKKRVEHLLRKMKQSFGKSKQFHILTASVGISQTEDSRLSIDVLMRQSDLALYQAKQDGRGIYRVYTPDMVHTQNES